MAVRIRSATPTPTPTPTQKRKRRRPTTSFVFLVFAFAGLVIFGWVCLEGKRLHQMALGGAPLASEEYLMITPLGRRERQKNDITIDAWTMVTTSTNLTSIPLLKKHDKSSQSTPTSLTKEEEEADTTTATATATATATHPVTAVAVIAFANATRTRLVERVVRSVQSRGQWNRTDIPIVIITDHRGHYERIFRRNEDNHDNNNINNNNINNNINNNQLPSTTTTTTTPYYYGNNPIVVLYPQRQDWDDIPDSDFSTLKLKYKRFKTRLADYMEFDNRLQSVTRILYLDIDTVVCQPLSPFMDRYWKKYVTDYNNNNINNNGYNGKDGNTGNGGNNGKDRKRNSNNNNHNNNNKSNNTTTSWMMAFTSAPGQGKSVHSGIMVLDRNHSQGCLTQWRSHMDKGRTKYVRDQEILRKMRNHKLKNSCDFRLFARNKQDMFFPQPNDFEKIVNKNNNNDKYYHFPVFLHITNTHHVHLTNASIQQAYLEEALLLTKDERRRNTSLAITVDTF